MLVSYYPQILFQYSLCVCVWGGGGESSEWTLPQPHSSHRASYLRIIVFEYSNERCNAI
jgi:hypothetical protein